MKNIWIWIALGAVVIFLLIKKSGFVTDSAFRASQGKGRTNIQDWNRKGANVNPYIQNKKTGLVDPKYYS